MRTTVELPESVYQKSAEAARRLGVSTDELVAQVLERELAHETAVHLNAKRINPPLIHSKNPGSLDLTDYDFDDLLS